MQKFTWIVFCREQKTRNDQRSLATGGSPRESGDERVIMDLNMIERRLTCYRLVSKLNTKNAKY